MVCGNGVRREGEIIVGVRLSFTHSRTRTSSAEELQGGWGNNANAEGLLGKSSVREGGLLDLRGVVGGRAGGRRPAAARWPAGHGNRAILAAFGLQAR